MLNVKDVTAFHIRTADDEVIGSGTAGCNGLGVTTKFSSVVNHFDNLEDAISFTFNQLLRHSAVDNPFTLRLLVFADFSTFEYSFFKLLTHNLLSPCEPAEEKI
jgi:calcineurin-like phosphoesterase